MAAKGAGYWKRRACLCGRLAGKGPSVAVWARCQKKKKKSHNKLIGHSLIVRFSPPPLSLSTGQHTEEGHCSAHSGEEGAAGGAEGEERRYCTSEVFKFTSPSLF